MSPPPVVRSADVLAESRSFAALLVPPHIVAALRDYGIRAPSPVQHSAVPLARLGADLIVQAKAGTGKTVVFAVAAAERVDLAQRAPQVLVLAPTREVALQGAEVVAAAGARLPAPGLAVGAFIGGLPVEEDQRQLRRTCHVAVGTPGRILSLIGRGWLATSGVRMLVLDEADKLLGDAFRKDVMAILSHLPQPRQMLALSATYAPPVLAALRRLMRRPQEVLLCEETTSLLAVKQFYRVLAPAGSAGAGASGSPDTAAAAAAPFQLVQQQNGSGGGGAGDEPAATHGGGGGGPAFEAKARAAAQLLAAVPFQQALVFCSRRVEAEAMAAALSSAGFAASHLSAERSQLERIGALNALRDYRTRVAVTTDLVARGVDLEGVTLVVNADLPGDAATLMHRVGRAGRFGTRGLAVTLLAGDAELGALRRQLEEVAGGEAFLLPDPVPEDWFGYHVAQSETLRRQRAQGKQPLEQRQQQGQGQEQQQGLPHTANGAGTAHPPGSSSGQLAALGSLLALGSKGGSPLDAPGSPTGPLSSVAAASLWFDEPRDLLPAPTASWARTASPPEQAAAAARSSSSSSSVGGGSTQHHAEEAPPPPPPPPEPPRTPAAGLAPTAPAADLGPDIQVASLVCLKPEIQPSELTAAVAAAARAEAAAAAAAAAEAGSESDSWASSSDDVLSSSDDERAPQPPAAHHPQQRWRQRHGSGRLPRSALRLALVGAGQHHHGAAGHLPGSPRRRSAGRRWPMGAADGSRALPSQPEPASSSRLSSRPAPIPSEGRGSTDSCGAAAAAATPSEALAVPAPGAERGTLAVAATAGDRGADGPATVAGGSSEDDEPSFGESWLDEAAREDERRERRLRRAAAAAAEEGEDACSVDLSPEGSRDVAAQEAQLQEQAAAAAAPAMPAGFGGRHYWEVVERARQDILSRLEGAEGCQPEQEGQQWGEGQQEPIAPLPRRRAPLGSAQAAAAARRQAEEAAAAAAGEGPEPEGWDGPSDLAAAAAYLEALAEGNDSEEEEEAAAETAGSWVEAAAAAATEHQAAASAEAHGADVQAWHDYWQSYYAAYGCYPSADALQQGRATTAAAASQMAGVPPPPPVPPPPTGRFDGWNGALERGAAGGGSTAAPSATVLQAQLQLWQDWQQKYADWCAVWQQFLAGWSAGQQEQQPEEQSERPSSADTWEGPQVTL